MTLQDYIKEHKLGTNIFIILYNTDLRWIICGTRDDTKLQDYMSYLVEEQSELNPSKFIRCLKMTNYTDDLQIGYYQMKAEQDRLVSAQKVDKKKRRR